MAEVKMGASGFPGGRTVVAAELYRLLCIFASSPFFEERSKGDWGGGGLYASSVEAFEYEEIARILLVLSATMRNEWDLDPEAARSRADRIASVGQLVPHLAVPDRLEPLSIRESFNKVLHARTITLERSEPRPVGGHLEPCVHLYGAFNGKEWKATLDIYRWAEAVHMLTGLATRR